MKRTILLTLLIISGMVCYSQRLVVDRNSIQTISQNHAVTYANLVTAQGQYKNMKDYNQKIATDATQIALIRERLYISLQDVQNIQRYQRSFTTIQKLLSDIAKYQTQMLDYASGDPKLVAVAVSAETQLISQMINTLSYLEMAVNGSSDNLMNTKQRLELLTHVIMDLRKARGNAYTVVRKMKQAQKRGLLYALTHNGYSYHRNGAEIKDEILQNYRPHK